MAVETFLRGVMVVGVLIVGVLTVGGITASAVLDGDEPAPRAKRATPAIEAPKGDAPSGDAPSGDAPSTDEEADLAVAVTAATSGQRPGQFPGQRPGQIPGQFPGQIELELPGGFGIKLPTNEKIFDGADFDIGGVGLYPGAATTDMKVRVLSAAAADGARALVDRRFTTPDSPDKVISWYQRAFARQNITVTRNENQLAGTTQDGDRFTLALQSQGSGALGTIRLRAGKAL